VLESDIEELRLWGTAKEIGVVIEMEERDNIVMPR